MCVVFLGDTARGIFFPTLWKYVQAMGGDRITLGYSVGAFSLGRQVAVMISPYFGGLSTKHGYRKVLMVASGLIALGALAYALAWTTAALIGAQIIMGVGSGTLGVTRAYVADKSTPEQRTYLLAYTTAVQYAGFTCMPFVGGFLSFVIKDRRIPLLGEFLVLNSFTAPAYVMVVAALILFALLKLVFEDSIPKGKPTKTSKQVRVSTKRSTPLVKTEAEIAYSSGSAAKYLMGAPSDVSLARSGWMSDSDTDDQWPPAEPGARNGSSGPGLFMDSDDEDETRRPSGVSATTTSTAAAAVKDSELGLLAAPSGNDSNGYGSVPAPEEGAGEEGRGQEEGLRREEQRWCRAPTASEVLIYGGFLLNMSTKGTIACFETLGAEYAMTHFGMTSAEAGSTFATFGSIGVVSLLSMRLICRYLNDVQIVLGGMGVMIVACLMFVRNPEGASGLPLFLWAVFLMYSVGYPIGHTAVLGLFSKVVGAQPQGALLGWFGSAGSLARIGFPVVAGEQTRHTACVERLVAVCTAAAAAAAVATPLPSIGRVYRWYLVSRALAPPVIFSSKPAKHWLPVLTKQVAFAVSTGTSSH
ncbi:unnamed protein product [Ectocarpus sp. 13 AM-2016]